ncbi:MAG: glucan 1,4-alpha-glucosidase [Desulfobacterales bacterium]|nr:glucan 1,4-alpha-glucosidase [Desulfobacterales bacterium]
MLESSRYASSARFGPSMGSYILFLFQEVMMNTYWPMITKLVLAILWVAESAIVSAAGGGQTPEGSGTNQYGAPSIWSSSMKQGIGTSYEKYNSSLQAFGHTETDTVSKVWFSLAEGIVTETAFGLIHEAQLKDMGFLITGISAGGWFDEERVATNHSVTYVHTDGSGRPLSPAYRIINTDVEGRYRITKDVFTDPGRQTLFMRVVFQAFEDGVTPYLLVNPHMENTGNQDVGFTGAAHLGARNVSDNRYMIVRSSSGFVKTSAGYVGVNDGWNDLHPDRIMNFEYDSTHANPPAGRGNVALTGQLETVNTTTVTFDITVGFGNTFAEAEGNALGSLSDGYNTVLNRYNGVGSDTGWEDYIAGLSELSSMVSATGDNGRLLYTSALMLKSMEDKTHAGALIACLCVPWGESVSADGFATGYRAVWVRDFFQVGMAFLAMGDKDTAKVAFKYLPKVQVKSSTPGVGSGNRDGWFLQKTHVDGTLEWIGLQKDQAAMPIMYAHKLWKAGVLSDAEINSYYGSMLKPAAEFLSHKSAVDINGPTHHNTGTFDIDVTQQERWEEEGGKSPSTNAAVIAGLVAAADIANFIGGTEVGAAAWYRLQADAIYSTLNDMYTTTGFFGDGDYIFRITDGSGQTCTNNGGTCEDERAILDGGFLELVRYGVLEPDDPRVLESLEEYNDQSLADVDRVRYDFNFSGTDYPGWRRYSQDRYGERRNDCSNFTGNNFENRGRVWPFLTGEYGTYVIDNLYKSHAGSIPAGALNNVGDTYVQAMEHFANDSNLLPEQVYDGVCSSGGSRFIKGNGTNSATPLAWSHAEYIKLVRSIRDGENFSKFAVVDDRYPLSGGGTVQVTFECSQGHTIWGQSVYIVGNISELGDWNPGAAQILSPTSYPTWRNTYNMPASTTFEWKGIKRWETFPANAEVIWEPGQNNVITTPASGSMIVTDCQF